MNLQTPDKGINYIVDTPSRSKTGSDPITVSDFKDWAKIEHSADDTLIGSLISEIVDQAEPMLDLALVTQDIILIMDIRNNEIRLPFMPIKSLTKIEYFEDKAFKELDPANYTLMGESVILDNATATYYRISYTAGYDTIPVGLNNALKQAILTAYQDREDNVEGGVSRIPSHSLNKLMIYKRY